MAKLGINTGSIPNDGTGDTLLAAALKINQNFDEIYSTLGDGSNLSGVVTSLVGYATEGYVDAVISGISTVGLFDQDLNTTNDVTFNRIGITTGEISVGSDNNLSINVEGMGQPYTYTFGSGGNANFPGNIEIGSGGYSFFEDSGVDSAIQANPVHNFKIHVGGYNTKVWAFSTDGSLTLPGGTVATSSSITTPIPNTQFQDGDPFAIRIYRGIDEDYVSFNFENDRLVFPDGNGRIITGGGEWTLDTANNILGFPSNDYISYDDNNGSGFDFYTYEKPIRITTAQTNVWAFSTDGSIRFPDNTVQTTAYTGGGLGESYWLSTAAGIHTLSNVGVGTTNATSKLTVQGDVSVSGVSTFSDTVNAQNIVSTNISANGHITIKNTGTELRFQDSGGNPASVRVGDESGGSAYASSNVFLGYRAGYLGQFTNNSQNVFVGAYAGNDLVTSYGNVIIGRFDGVTSELDLSYSPSNSGYIVLANGLGDIRLVANPSGNVGIATTNPTSKLTVNGDALISGIITATTFVGNFSGSITDATNLTGGYANASSLNVSGIATISAGRIQVDASSNIRLGNLPAGSGSGRNIAIGDQVLASLSGGSGRNIGIGELSYYDTTTGQYNIGIGERAGQKVTTGAYNVILGAYDGNSGNLDIRTLSNNVVIADGQGNIRQYINSSGNVGIKTTVVTEALTVAGVVSATSFYGTLNAGQLTGTLPAIDGSALLNVVGSGSGVIVQDDATPVGTAGTINFGSNLSVSFASGIATVSGASSVSEATTAYGLSGTPNIYAGLTTVSYLRAGNYSDINSATIVGYSPMSGGNIAVDSKNLQLAANGIDNGNRGNIIFYRKEAFLNQSEIATLYSDTGNLSIDGSLTSGGNSDNSFNGSIKVGTVVGTAITLSNSGHINATGVVTATSFYGSGANLTSLPAGQLTGALPAIDGSALLNVTAAGTGVVVEDDQVNVGSATTIDFGTGLDVTFSAGIATITASGGSLQSRTIVTGVTTSIANNGIGNTDITGFKSYALMKVGLSTAGWLRLYTDSTSRANDASRSVGVDPAPGSGVIAEVVTTGISTTQIISPFVMGGNLDNPADTTIYAAITNLSGSTQAITANLTILQLEA